MKGTDFLRRRVREEAMAAKFVIASKAKEGPRIPHVLMSRKLLDCSDSGIQCVDAFSIYSMTKKLDA